MGNKNLSKLIKKISVITTIGLSSIIIASNAVNFAVTQYALYNEKRTGETAMACENAINNINEYSQFNLLKKIMNYGSKMASKRYIEDNCNK